MTGLILEFLFLAVAIVLAGTFLTYYTDRLAEATGLGKSLAGLLLLTIVALVENRGKRNTE